MTKKKAIMAVGSSLLLLVFLAATASAQSSPNDKGSINIGGMFSFDSYGGEWWGDDGYTQMMIVPSFRYFIIPGLAVGADLMVNRWDEGDWAETMLGIGPAVAYMLKTSNENLYPYAGAKLLLIRDSWDGSSASGFDIGFGGGLAYMLAKNVAVTAELNYHIQRWSWEGESEGGHLLSLSVGLAVFLY